MTTLSQELRQFADIWDKIEENDGVVTDELLPALRASELGLPVKVDNYVKYLNNLDALKDRYNQQLMEIKATLKTINNIETKLKDNAKYEMEANDLKQLDGHIYTIKIANNGGVKGLECPDDMFEHIEVVTDSYIAQLMESKAIELTTAYVLKDKTEFRKLVEAGVIDGCSLRERGKSLKISYRKY